jgi:DNA-binding XRE family transcriptional regulator
MTDEVNFYPYEGNRSGGKVLGSALDQRLFDSSIGRLCQRRRRYLSARVRKARSLSQEDVAEALTVNQPAVAKLEKRNDMHVSNLRRYIEALGGTLEITAHFGKKSVVINNLGEGTP